MVRATALNISALILILAASVVVAQQNATNAPVQEDCSRAGLVKAISAIPDTATSTKILTGLNLQYLLPDGKGKGTLFLPKDNAYTSLGVPVDSLISTLQNQTVSIFAYHFLFGQKKSLSRSELKSSSPIKTDLAFLQENLGQNNNSNYDVQVTSSLTKNLGLEFVQGVNPKNLALTRGVIKVCGYYIYPVEMVLIPADTLAGVPSNPGAALKEATAAGFDLNTPKALGVAVQDKSFKFPQQSYAAAQNAGGTASASTQPGGASSSAASPTSGGGGGTMPTSSSASSPNSGSDAPTSKRGKNRYGKWRSKKERSADMARYAQSPGGAMGPNSAMGPGAMGPGAMGPGAMGPGAMGPGAMGPGAMAPDGAPQAANAPDIAASIAGLLGAALAQNGTNSTISSKRPIVFQGSMTPKTGSPTDVLLFVNGTIVDGVGTRGKAYPVKQVGVKSIVIDKTKGEAIKGVSFEGMVFNAGKIVPKLLAANGAIAIAPGVSTAQASPQAVAPGPAAAVVAVKSSATSHVASAAAVLACVAATTLYMT